MRRRRAGETKGWRQSAVGLFLALAGVLVASRIAQAQPVDEYAMRSAFLFNFAQFVDWPVEAFTGHPDRMRFCILGKDPFGPVIDRSLSGKTVQGRRIEVVRLHQVKELQPCQLVYLAAEAESHLAEVLAELRGRPVLVVGEAEGFTHRGGMIRLFLKNDRGRFQVNHRAADEAGLRLSSKLLELAESIDSEDR